MTLLILAAAFGIAFRYRAVCRLMLAIPCLISNSDYRASTSDRVWDRWQRYSNLWRNGVGLALSVAVAAISIGISGLQSQIDVPATSPGTAEIYLIQGESLSGNQQYDRAIAAYTAPTSTARMRVYSGILC